MYDLGGNVPLKITLYAADGVTPTNAASVVFTVTLPDGTTQTPTVANPSTGVYTATGPSTLAGRYPVRYVTTNPTDAKTDEYEVRPAASIALLSLADARQSLNFVSQLNDEELRVYIDAATDMIEQEVGPILPRTVVETVHGYGTIALTQVPVLSVTSINGQLVGSWAIDPTDLDINLTTGVIHRFSRDTFYNDLYTITYVAGRSTVVPERFRQAARAVIRNLWDAQRGRGRPSQGGEDEIIPAMGMTPDVLFALRHDMKVAGIA